MGGAVASWTVKTPTERLEDQFIVVSCLPKQWMDQKFDRRVLKLPATWQISATSKCDPNGISFSSQDPFTRQNRL